MAATAPRLFLSYSWSSPDHEAWVIRLAESLCRDGVDVILDKWALREGHDATAFMEQMVNDASIAKVVMVCDEVYATKANGRAGGVGTETQIISSEVYSNQSQDKFVAVLAERDASGKPFLPTYYKSRIYVDLSNSDSYVGEYERLVRWIFDKPLHKKPDLGQPPAFLQDEAKFNLGTSLHARRALEAIKTDQRHKSGAVADYLSAFAQNTERTRVENWDENRDESVVAAIAAFAPFRSEYLEVVSALAQYASDDSYAPQLHSFFEVMAGYYVPPEGVTSYYKTDFDHFKFVAHELFLATLATLIRNQRFSAVNSILGTPLYLAYQVDRGRDPIATFTVLRQYVESLEQRNRRLSLRRLSLRADMLRERATGARRAFEDMMQADFICFLRASLQSDSWWPETLLYATHHHGPFELFARSTSRAYLMKVLPLLGIEVLNPDSGLAALKDLMRAFSDGTRRLPRWEFDDFDPAVLLGLEELGKRP